ncbi:MAG: hypothetical protein IT219_12125 [Bacteroidales bacterium]|nr:hypothetical protein [Bacteroidales bacterium]
MRLIITDTNIIIDMIQAGALEHFVQLNFEICTTDLVVEEVKQPEQRLMLDAVINQGLLRVIELESDDIRRAFELKTGCNLKRITDKTVLLKAIDFQCMVLSGDKDLRKECLANGLEVHGSIWVMQQIWLAGTVSKEMMEALISALRRYARVPETELDKLLKDLD